MFLVENIDDLWNHIAYVLGSAPDRFPREDFLPDDQQMTLDRAFEQLHQGVEVAYPEPVFDSKRAALNDILERSYAAYKAGKDIAAGKLLNEFQDNIFRTE